MTDASVIFPALLCVSSRHPTSLTLPVPVHVVVNCSFVFFSHYFFNSSSIFTLFLQVIQYFVFFRPFTTKLPPAAPEQVSPGPQLSCIIFIQQSSAGAAPPPQSKPPAAVELYYFYSAVIRSGAASRRPCSARGRS